MIKTLLSRFVIVSLAVVLAACTERPSAQTPAPMLIAANTIDERPELAAKGMSRVVASDTKVAQTIALWRAISRSAVGQQIEWSNSVTSDHGTALVVREVLLPESDRMCREYRQDSVINGRAHRTIGQVCQQHDGNWIVISDQPEAFPALAIGNDCREGRHQDGTDLKRGQVCRG